MSKFDALAKLLGISAEQVAKHSDEILNTLEKVNTPEIASKLSAAELGGKNQGLFNSLFGKK